MSQAGVKRRAGVTTMEADAEVRGGDRSTCSAVALPPTSTPCVPSSPASAPAGAVANTGCVRCAGAYSVPAKTSACGSAFRLRRDVPVAFIVLTDTEDQSVRQQGCRETDANGDGRSDDADCVDRAIRPTLSLLRGEMGA